MSREDEFEFNSYVPPKYTYKIRYKDKMHVFDKLSECCKFLNSLDVLDKPVNTNKLLKYLKHIEDSSYSAKVPDFIRSNVRREELPYKICEYCGKKIYLGRPYFMRDYRSNIFCSPRCIAYNDNSIRRIDDWRG